MLIAITGTPATGKTTIAKELAKALNWKQISLNDLAREKNFYLGYDEKRKAKIVDIESIKKEIEKIMKKQKNLIIESHYAHEIPVDLVIVLRTDLKELEKRMLKKGWWKEKIQENLQAEIFGICKEEALKTNKNVFEIDTTGKKPKEVIKEILERIK